ncbi:hypothetical protein GCM10010302_23430 [Streptomyces polychromogenes]|uniref:RDD family membrane protein YckC n=1 Tax=Streptomyces polychromogenes TaxID=67342 RepID=A0ABN0VBU4_9ACTN
MTASPGDGEHAAREGFYPDPSIPGYVRYWNGAAWVPGTSRPAPARVEETGPVFLDDTSATEALPDPGPGPRPAVRDHAAATAWRGEPARGGRGGDPAAGPWGAAPSEAPAPDGGREAPAHGGWQADPAHQAGFGGPRDVRVSWGGPDVGEPEDARPGGISLARPAAAAPAARRLPAQAGAESVGILSARPPAWPEAPGTGVSGLTSSWPEATAPAGAPGTAAGSPAPAGDPGRAAGSAPAWPADPAPAWARTPANTSAPQAPARGWSGDPGPEEDSAGAWSGAPAAAVPGARAGSPAREWSELGAPEAGGSSAREWSAAQDVAAAGRGVRSRPEEGSAAARAGARHPGPGRDSVQGRAGTPEGAAPTDGPRAPAPGPERGAVRGVRPEPERGSLAAWSAARAAAPADPGRAPEAAEAGHGGPAAAARAGVRAAAGPAGPAAHAPSSAPAAPPEAAVREDSRAVFERMAERAVRPAGLVRRGLARLLDSLVLAGVAAAVAVPLVPEVTAHLQAKVDAARASGRTTTVWLLDATTAGRLGLVLGAVLLFGVFYEALPTARWGRTPGKKLCGVRVLATATLRPPGFGAALLRWLVFASLGLPGTLWSLADRPRRRGLHDRAARTYAAR